MKDIFSLLRPHHFSSQDFVPWAPGCFLCVKQAEGCVGHALKQTGPVLTCSRACEWDVNMRKHPSADCSQAHMCVCACRRNRCAVCKGFITPIWVQETTLSACDCKINRHLPTMQLQCKAHNNTLKLILPGNLLQKCEYFKRKSYKSNVKP